MLDLHGYTIHVAWKEFNSHITDCYHQKLKTTVVITGQGEIAKNFQFGQITTNILENV